ncbi:finTRIM family, member 16 isoform X1 [Silurus asotus]|uniref:FinTRIM family, member 16 isoform X1 n=1 Tax=Silurus asotus TaxID=30991 RepID=A0AAD5FPN4_SILAS|nr:finTRIM family, member 16 isoform X1 [Silurus asotus]
MAEASISICQEHLNCSICLSLLNNPVTTPCGHSFCMVCINGFWDSKDQKKAYSCPQCRETFTPRPVLRKNNVLTEIIARLEKQEHQTSFAQALDIISIEAEDVECDSCIGVKEKAVKSCLTCLASYCDMHVQAHHESPAFKKHTLIKAMGNLHEKTCAQHNKLLEMFCRNDQRVICYQCSVDKHGDHDIVPVQEEWIKKQNYFKDLQHKYQNTIKMREKTLQELKDVIDAYKRSAQEAVEDTEKIFNELLMSIEKRRSEVTNLIRAQEKAELAQTAEVLKQLETEIADVKKKQAQLEKLSQTSGYVHFLQKEEVEQFCKEKVENVSENVIFDQIIVMPEPKTRAEFLKYTCELSLDPNTAHCFLELANDNTYVTSGNREHDYPDHPERFTEFLQVLCKQRMPPRAYLEVEVNGKNGVSIAVSYKSINRKGPQNESRFGHNAQSWRLVRYPKGYCFWQNNTKINVSGPISQRIGVYLDQKAGTLSIYSVSDKMTLIHKVTTAFTQPLYAGFGIGTGSSAKIYLQASEAMTTTDGAQCLKKK